MRIFTTEEILQVIQKKGHIVFEKDNKLYNLNLIGVRNSTPVPNKFDDRLFVLWRFQGAWNNRNYPITTDPGLFFLNQPDEVKGTAILKEGQYMGMWQIGLHRGKYEALVQIRPCVVLRDADRDNQLDFDSKIEESGCFGINMHRAIKDAITRTVDNFSAGCQVFANSHDFDEVMSMARAAAATFGNSFTYTLLNEKDFMG